MKGKISTSDLFELAVTLVMVQNIYFFRRSNLVIKFGILYFQNCFTIKVLLPKFFSTFKNSFSYGEGCLVLQSLVVFIVKSFLCVIHDENDPSKVDGSFNIIANVGLISLLSLCSVPYVPFLTFINSSNVFYLTGE